MDQIEPYLSLRCPDHKSQLIGMLNMDPDAKKVAYCYGCIERNNEEGVFIKTLKSVPSYLKESSDFYEKCRFRAQSIGEPPANYIEEFSKKGECLEKFSKYIDQEKHKVNKNFEEMRKSVLQIINQKERECLQLLEKEILGLSEAYLQFEKLLLTGWPKPADIQAMYPELDVLIQKISKLENIDQLQAFMTGVQGDIQREKIYGLEKDGLERRKSEIDSLIRCFNVSESAFPKVKSNLLNPENIENLMKEIIQQEAQVENSILARINGPSYGSRIIQDEQFIILKEWLPQGVYQFDLKLLFRGSVDGLSAQMFHEKCDDQGSTITLIKCRFGEALESSILGGFLEQSWHSNEVYSTSYEAFLFSISNSVKCPISQPRAAFYGSNRFGPVFGQDLAIDKDLQTGNVGARAYSNTDALYNDVSNFHVEEIEVFRVK